ncbi:MAG: aldehyde ferredoxin oxidoreductase [Anaerolineales bacterium]|nr:MAG: aldehyde ferredoxin oxidoreductase [Anaerolineales bacterium]
MNIREIGAQRILNVDLTTGQVSTEEVSHRDLVRLLGGRGLAAKMLYKRVPAGIDPLGPENVLIWSPGTLSGTNAPSSGRTSVTCKSPATGLYLKVSVGGHLGAELKYAGYDYLVISGRASHPVYLWIDDDQVEIRQAQHLWGKGTRETDDLIKAELGDDEIQTGIIGPAGENKVLFSCIMVSRYNSAARGGVGAVMGSKNLKAVAVRGRGALRMARPQPYFELAARMRRELAADAGSESLYNWGTSGSIPGLDEMGMLAAYNFSQVTIANSERLSGQYLVDEGYLTGRESCFACSTACHRYVKSHSDRWGDVDDSGPELETIMSLGAECGLTDTEAVLMANRLCNDYGLDTISAGHVISWAMECYERGVISPKQADGLELCFGNAEAQLELIRRIAFREGLLADLLAEGTQRASAEVGGDSWKWAIQAKGLEQSAVDTRAAKSYALAFAVNPRGPDHLMTETYAEFGFTEESRDVIRKITGDEKYANATLLEKRADIVRWHEDCYAATEALGFCVFTSTAAFAVNPENMAELFGHALGIEFSEEELMLGGRRIVTLERCFNAREGARRKDDVLPWRMMNEPVPNGPNKGMITDQAMLDRFLDEYYALHGWDPATGIPRPETLKTLDLADVCSVLPEA